jgi:hypothetical protein
MPHQRSEQPTLFELTASNEFDPLGGLPLNTRRQKWPRNPTHRFWKVKFFLGSAGHSSLQVVLRTFSCSVVRAIALQMAPYLFHKLADFDS